MLINHRQHSPTKNKVNFIHHKTARPPTVNRIYRVRT